MKKGKIEISYLLLIEVYRRFLRTLDICVPLRYFLLVVFVAVIIIIIYRYKLNYYKQHYNIMFNRVNEYELIIDEQGKANHEFNNQLMVISGYINDKNKLREYLNSIIGDHKTGKYYDAKQLSHLPNNGLKSLVYFKLSKMKDNKIKPYLYISEEVKTSLERIDIRQYKDITKILGVFLDNAIEAAKDANEKEVTLDMKKDKHHIVITISNTYKNQINISNFWKDRFTTKGINHGYGLKIVKDILNQNDILTVKSSQTEKEVIQTLLIEI